MPGRAIDHLVLPSRDLPLLVEAYRRLGFTVGGRNQHPWGTRNHIVQFDGTFLELLGFADEYQLLADDDPASPFAGFLADHLGQAQDDIAMVVLRSSDAQADAATFRDAGIGAGRLLQFSRTARTSDGRDKTVAFTIAFAEADTMPDIGFFTCEQHRPENFWNPAAQVHANGALAIEAVTIVAADPSMPLDFLKPFADPLRVDTVLGGFELVIEGGRIEVITPSAFALRSSLAEAEQPANPHVAAATITVGNLDHTRTHFAAQGLWWTEMDATIVVQPHLGSPTRLIFREAGE